VNGEALTGMLAEIGIEASEEDDFGWIAEVGLKTAMPPRWNARFDVEHGATYFVDTDTQTSTWQNPLAPHLARVVEVGRIYLRMPMPGLFEDQKALVWSEHKAELNCWHGPVPDGEGNTYFVNSAEGTSSWQDPRLSAQYIFDVQSSLLTHLEQILTPVEPEEEQEDLGGYFGGGTPWETPDGAQVLNLEGSSPREYERSSFTPCSRGSSPVKKSSKLSRSCSTPGLGSTGIKQALRQPEDHTLMLQQMSTKADWLNDTRQSEEEMQRVRLIRKVEERRMRKLSRKLTKAIQDSVQGDEDDQKKQRSALELKLMERRMNRAPLAPLRLGGSGQDGLSRFCLDRKSDPVNRKNDPVNVPGRGKSFREICDARAKELMEPENKVTHAQRALTEPENREDPVCGVTLFGAAMHEMSARAKQLTEPENRED